MFLILLVKHLLPILCWLEYYLPGGPYPGHNLQTFLEAFDIETILTYFRNVSGVIMILSMAIREFFSFKKSKLPLVLPNEDNTLIHEIVDNTKENVHLSTELNLRLEKTLRLLRSCNYTKAANILGPKF